MKIKIFLLISSIVISCKVVAQRAVKPIIDTSVLNTWPTLGRCEISNDGNYFSYVIEQPGHSRQLFLQAAHKNWRKTFNNVDRFLMSGDSKWFVFQKSDSLFFLRMGQAKIYKKCLIKA